MKRSISLWLAAFGLSFLACILPAQAQSQAQRPVAGTHYVTIDPPLATDNPDKIEVVEFFSYGCPHCFDLSASLNRWVAKLPADVTFYRVPVGFNQPYYQLMARFYYALEALGELERLDKAAFEAIHMKGLKLVDEKSLADWVASQGVDAKKFHDAFNAFGVVSKTRRADQMTQAAGVPGVPALVVDGRYRVLTKGIKEPHELLTRTDLVIEKRRAERAVKTAPKTASKAAPKTGKK